MPFTCVFRRRQEGKVGRLLVGRLKVIRTSAAGDHVYDGVASSVFEYVQKSTLSPHILQSLKHFNLVDFLERSEWVYDRDD